ncbi:MAG: DnaJ domain-containing protein [Bacteroidetes bacterium]|nr:DnaJ domain-containing protein [Bacteroidota bacterium]
MRVADLPDDYYQRLGVPSGCSADQIRRSFHKLARTYHPDVNKEPDALVKFQAIQEAYEVLSDPEKRYRYDNRHFNIEEPMVRHRDPAYRRRPAGRKQPSAEQELEVMMAKMMKGLIWVPRLGLVVVLVLLIDFLLPSIQFEDEVEFRGRWRSQYTIKTKSGGSFYFSLPEGRAFLREEKVLVTVSPVFGILKSLENSSRTYHLPGSASIFSYLAFAPIILALVSLLAVIKKWDLQIDFRLCVVVVLLLILNGALIAFSIW